MSESNGLSDVPQQRAPSPTPSEQSVKSDISTASSRLPKPSGLRAPSATITKPSTSASAVPSTPSSTRIGRICTSHGHGAKAGPPPLELHKKDTDPAADKMRRQSDEYSRSHLADVYEESEADLVTERNNNDWHRSTQSRSPDAYYSAGSKNDRKLSNGSTHSEGYVEATGRRRSSDQGVVLTTDTDQFIIGQRVYVGGHRPGQIAFIGETHFAPGDWAGIVLDNASGKNDGCVSGKRYFQCEPKRGIFSRLTRLTMEPLGDAGYSPTNSMNVSIRSIISPPRSGTVSPTRSVSSYVGKSPAKTNLSVGDRVIVSSGMGSRAGILQYLGETKFAPGNWCGVQLDEPSGKNDGTVDGVQYFTCPSNYGIFVPLAKVSLSPLSKKTRLSRAGSKESLTSIGTMGSIVSTNTSRLRMSAQRLSSASKPPAVTPRNTFSLQDLLREKQNHVEQLILERDLTRQQTENDTMMFQKQINQLNEKVFALEKQLADEQQKSEDLQFSIDEVTICGEDQTQIAEYRQKIAKLEKDILELNLGKSNDAELEELKQKSEEFENLRTEFSKKAEEVTSLRAQIEKLTTENVQLQASMTEAENNAEIKISSLGVSENCLREEIDYFKNQNEELKGELLRKDETTEKEYLNMRNIENELKEELAALQKALSDKNTQIEQLTSEVQSSQSAIESNKTEFGAKDSSIEELKKSESEKQATIDSLQEKLKKIEFDLSHTRDEIVTEKDRHIAKLSQDISELTKRIEEITEAKKSFEAEVNAKTKELAATEKKVFEVQRAFDLERELANDLRAQIDTINQCANKNEADFTKNLDDMVKEIDGIRTALNGAQNTNAELQKQNKTLAGEVTQLKTARESHQSTVDSLNERVRQLNEANTEGSSQIDSLNAEIKNQKTQMEELNKTNNEFKMKLNDLQRSLTSSNDENEQKERKLKELKQKLDQLQDQSNAESDKNKATIDEFKNKLQAVNSELSHISEKLSKSQIDFADLERQLSIAEQKQEQFQAEKVQLQKNAELLQSSSTDTSSELGRLVDELKLKQMQYDELVNQSNETKLKLEKRLHESQQSVATSNSQWQKLRDEIDSLTAQKIDRENELNLELSQIKDAYETELVSLRNEIDTLKAVIKTERENFVKAQQDKDAEYHEAISEYRSSIDNLENTAKNLNQQIRNANETVEKKSQEIASLLSRLNELELKYNEQVDQVKDAEASSKSIEQILNEQLQAKNNEIEKVNDKLTEKIKTMINLEEVLKATRSELQQVSREKFTTIEILQAQNTELTESKTEISNLYEELNAKYVELETKFKTLDETFRDTEDEQVDLVHKNLESQQQIAELTEKLKEIDQLKQHLEQQTTKLTNAMDQIENLQKEVQDTMVKFDESEKMKTDTETQLMEVNTNFEKYKVDAEQAKTEFENLIKSTLNEVNEKDKQIKELKEKVSQLAPSVNLSDDLKNELKDKSEELRQKETNITELNHQINELKKQCAEKDMNLTRIAEAKELENKRSHDEIEHKSNDLAAKQKEIEDMTLKLWDGEEKLKEQTEHLTKLLQIQSNDEEAARLLKTRETELLLANKKLEGDIISLKALLKEKDRLLAAAETSAAVKQEDFVADGEPGAQISFLNSIIADMQRKNEALKEQIRSAEPFKNTIFDVPISRKPAPRKFCDICDIFDAHDTDDCPVQSSESSPMHTAAPITNNGNSDDTKKRVIPPPRKYCNVCEMFDHEEGECNTEETY